MIKKILILSLLNIDGLKKNTIREIVKDVYYYFLLYFKNEEGEFLNSLKFALKDIEKTHQIYNLSIISDCILERAYYRSKNTIDLCERENIKITTVLDEDFPIKLKKLKNYPLAIYYKGDINCLNKRSVAVVGSRKPTSNGEYVAYNISKLISESDFCVVSGLASGCDTLAHTASLNTYNKKTIAVMPCSLDTVYPKNNYNLFQNIIQSGGCIISEYPPNFGISKYQFIQRNRLISALSEGVVVVEASLNGGSMHTVRYAFEQNKKVACYGNIANYKRLESVSGNIELLRDARVFNLYDDKSIYQFIDILNEANVGIY